LSQSQAAWVSWQDGQKKNEDKKLIFDDYEKFKEKLWQIFEIINKKQTAKQCIHILQQNELAVKYSTEF